MKLFHQKLRNLAPYGRSRVIVFKIYGGKFLNSVDSMLFPPKALQYRNNRTAMNLIQIQAEKRRQINLVLH